MRHGSNGKINAMLVLFFQIEARVPPHQNVRQSFFFGREDGSIGRSAIETIEIFAGLDFYELFHGQV